METISKKRFRLGVRKRKPGALNFERFAGEGNRFIKEVARELNVSRNSAARITKAVLHAVRDRLPPDDAVQFAQGLPMALKGVFIDQYDISSTPVIIRRAHDFLDYIFFKNEFGANVDFPEKDSVEQSLRAVFRILEKHMDEGQVNQVKRILGNEIVNIIEQDEPSFYTPLF
jgi:uncharacterized protein (DUF2267 family)